MLLDLFQKSMKSFGANEHFRYGLACSGGVDSMVLAELMYRSALPFQLLHVNYGLRQEADADEAFVRHWAEKRSIPYCIRKVEENEWKAFERKGIQHAARTIRYAFFDELKQAGEFDFILTAHHAQDLLERMLMAIIRGEQWTALAGLQAKRDHFLRPLLQADRESIEEFARTEKIEWREDASNSGSAYLRNRVRHELIPFFKKENPSWSEAVLRMHDELLAVKKFSSAAYSEWARKWTKEEEGGSILNRKALSDGLPSFPRQWIEERIGSALSQNFALPEHGSGQLFHWPGYRLEVEREYLFLHKSRQSAMAKTGSIGGEGEYEILGGVLQVERPKISKETLRFSQTEAFLDADKLNWPLYVRPWEKGDRFNPVGMRGSKLLSDYFIDNKWSRRQKETAKLLCCGDDIIWLIGHRVDGRYAANAETKKVCVIRWIDGEDDK